MCGQCAFIGDGSAFDPRLFKLLALAQDYWGGHGAGIAFTQTNKEGDKRVEVIGGIPLNDKPHIFKEAYKNLTQYTIDAGSLLELLCFEEDIEKAGLEEENDLIVMAHTRKATIGTVKLDFVQPLEKWSDERGSVYVTHNGTISNYQELAKTFGLENCKNDSQVLAGAIAQGREKEFFEVYSGAISCMWFWKNEPNTLYVYVGESEVKPKEASRALSYITLPYGVYISKDTHALKQLQWVFTTSESEPKYHNFKLNSITSFRITSDGVVNEVVATIPRRMVKASSYTAPEQGRFRQILAKVLNNEPKVADKNQLEFFRGIYMCNGEILHTEYSDEKGTYEILRTPYVDHRGYIYYKDEDQNWVTPKGDPVVTVPETLLPLYFIDGIMMRNKGSWLYLVKKFPSENWRLSDFVGHVTHPMWVGSLSPFLTKSATVQETMLTWYAPTKPYRNLETGVSGISMSGSFVPLFSTKRYIFSAGQVQSIEKLNLVQAQDLWLKVIKVLEDEEDSEEEKLARKLRVMHSVATRAVENGPRDSDNYKILNQIKTYLDGHLKKSESSVGG